MEEGNHKKTKNAYPLGLTIPLISPVFLGFSLNIAAKPRNGRRKRWVKVGVSCGYGPLAWNFNDELLVSGHPSLFKGGASCGACFKVCLLVVKVARVSWCNGGYL